MIPEEIGAQLDELVAGLRSALGDNIIGIYLHGSAVLGCFGPRSDIDLLLVLAHPTSIETKLRMAELLLAISAPYEPPGAPRPVEIDVIAEENLRPWRYPARLDFHYSEEFREQLWAGNPQAWEGLESRDLAAHVTILRQAGISIGGGPPVDAVLPEVPWPDYVDALTHDLEWCRTRFVERPGYGVLSIARVWATLATRTPHSKASGAEWALPLLPAEIHPVLEHGAAFYAGREPSERWDQLPVAEYVTYVADAIERL